MSSTAAGNRDRNPGNLDFTKTPWPVAPLNVFLKSGFEPGTFDLSWTDPAEQVLNASFNLLGVNLYRSFDSEFGPYQRVTELPVGARFWRDQTDNELVLDEDVSNSFLVRGTTAAGQTQRQFVFRVLHWPIVKEASQSTPANSPFDVQVFIDGVQARILRVHGESGEVEIDPRYYVDPATQKQVSPILPVDGSRVTCSYRYTRALVKTDLAQRIFYRVTTVGIPVNINPELAQPEQIVETPLEHAAATNNFEIEKLDYIWQEAVRRNRWILEQGGERVKVFLRKNVGLTCTCFPDNFHKQPLADCLVCFGTGIVGGYEGPYDILIAPDDSEKAISQKEYGRNIEHTFESWTGPVPLLSQRDFIVKINGDRYSIGAVRHPNNRQNILQQHFNLGHIDEKDIRNKVPVGSPIKFAATQFATSGPEQEASADPTHKPNIPGERQLEGRTKAWENIEY
jgi:hypothetical protein